MSSMVQSLFKSLNTRQQEIIAGRFGLEKFKSPQTLAALGGRYGITRERVRQIEASALKIIHANLEANPAAKKVCAQARQYLKNNGGVAKREDFLSVQRAIEKDLTENFLALLVEASQAFYFQPEADDFFAFYYLDKESFQKTTSYIHQWESVLKESKKDVLEGSYQEVLKKFLKAKNVSAQYLLMLTNISKKFHTNAYGDVGLAEWPEVKPSTIRDRIYLVLKKKNAPLHFRSIAQVINQSGLNKHVALAPTVHNELIKDERFVLVGRGMYGLREHGYEPGTAREVISKILRKQGPLDPKQVVLAVQQERFLKPNTILVNLQNKSFFERRSDGKYYVRES